MSGKLAAAAAIGLIGLATPVRAQESYTPADLGKTLTPFGAIKAGNKDGSIPAWDGGLTAGPAGWKTGDWYADPYAADKPVFTITGANADQYAGKLSAGIMALLKQYNTYKVNVYPTHRSAAAPQYAYDAAIANATRAHLSEDGLNVLGGKVAAPFPIPKNGSEAMFNSTNAWLGVCWLRAVTVANPLPNGDYTLIKLHEKVYFPYAEPDSTDNALFMYYSATDAPPRFAGELLLANGFTDPSIELRQAWTYNPGQRRVRRAPEVDYDTPITQSDSLATDDDYNGFNGALDRFNWKLAGRKEMIVPYNVYKLTNDPSLDYAQSITPSHLNPDYIRWETHRVWQIEATVRPETRHVYSKRTYYQDEDSGQLLLVDKYDGRGQLWRTTQEYSLEHYDAPLFSAEVQEWNDLIARRYSEFGLHNKEKPETFTGKNCGVTRADFTPDVLRREGIR